MAMNAALELLESPGNFFAGRLENVLRVPTDWERDLLLVVAAIYARPEVLPADIASRLKGMLREPAVTTRVTGLAREVMEFLLATPHAGEVLAQAVELASQPGLAPEVHAAVAQFLEYAAGWVCPQLRLSSLVALAELEHQRPHRRQLCERVVEPAIFAAGATLEPAMQERIARLYEGTPGLRYLLYILSQWQQFSATTRRWAAAAAGNQFPWRSEAAQHLGGEGRRVLVVHNIDDGQGDEIARWVPLVQAFLDFNPMLEAVVVTRRTYLGAHPRLKMISILDRPATDALLQQHFDAVIDFFESNVTELNYRQEIEPRVQEYVREQKPFLFASSTKGYNRWVFERVEVNGQPVAEGAGLNVQRVDNIYETAARLIAEFGLPLRCGEDPPASEFVLAGLAWPEAQAAWNKLVEGNTSARPVAIFNPFGGRERLKGFVQENLEAGAAEIERLVAQGYFVVVLPNGTAWGTAPAARQLVDRLSANCRVQIAIASDPAGAETLHLNVPGAPPLTDADYLMRQLFYYLRYADMTVTVEGWAMHVAWCLGKPFRVLMLPYSHPASWHPYARTLRQGMELSPAKRLGSMDDATPPLVEQPRKFVLRFLLREIGRHGDWEALPLLRKAAGSPDRDLRRAAAEALAGYPGEETVRDLTALLQDSWSAVRAVAAAALLKRPGTGDMRPAELLAHWYINAKEPNWRPLVGLGAAALPALEAAAKDDDPLIRRQAEQTRLLVEFQTSVRRNLYDGRPVRARWGDALRALVGGSNRQPPPAVGPGTVLILTPVKDAVPFLQGYCRRLHQLAYPHRAISIGLLESDSIDDTFEAAARYARQMRKEFRRVGVWKRDFGYYLPVGHHRGEEPIQAGRRAILAKSRNHLLHHALDDEEWVLWLDVDVIEYPPDIIERLLATKKDVVQPHCVWEYHGQTFDKNAWRDHGRLHLEDLRTEGDLVELDAVGGTMLLVRADLHREGLAFPAYPYGLGNSRARDGRGELETEGLGVMAHDMGYRCWGMPNLEIRHGRW